MKYPFLLFLILIPGASRSALNQQIGIGSGLSVCVLSIEKDGTENIQVFGAESVGHAQAARALYEVRFNKRVRTIMLESIPTDLAVTFEE